MRRVVVLLVSIAALCSSPLYRKHGIALYIRTPCLEGSLNKITTSPQICCRTTLWNAGGQLYSL